MVELIIIFSFQKFKKLKKKLNLVIYKMAVKRKIKDAKAWIKKYLIADSVEIKLFVSIIRGIKDNKLISNPIHIPIQEEEEIAIKDPVISVVIKINLDIKFNIKKKRVRTFISGVWTQ